jgi:hypothetical protein
VDLLLTPAPLECLNDELDQISLLGPHFYVIAGDISFDLRKDRRADKLMAALNNFCLLMYSASEEIHDTFRLAYNFYLHSPEERRGPHYNPGPITEARVAKLLEPEFQAKALVYARKTASQAAKASKALREHALPLVPQLEQELDSYVTDCVARSSLIDERKKSRIPSVLQDAIWGVIEPPPRTQSGIKTYTSHLSIAMRMLHKLPAFLDNLELHFQRLSEVDSQQILEYGYTTPNDLTRLFKDRLLCQRAVEQMRMSWFSPSRAISLGLPHNKV